MSDVSVTQEVDTYVANSRIVLDDVLVPKVNEIETGYNEIDEKIAVIVDACSEVTSACYTFKQDIDTQLGYIDADIAELDSFRTSLISAAQTHFNGDFGSFSFAGFYYSPPPTSRVVWFVEAISPADQADQQVDAVINKYDNECGYLSTKARLQGYKEDGERIKTLFQNLIDTTYEIQDEALNAAPNLERLVELNVVYAGIFFRLLAYTNIVESFKSNVMSQDFTNALSLDSVKDHASTMVNTPIGEGDNALSLVGLAETYREENPYNFESNSTIAAEISATRFEEAIENAYGTVPTGESLSTDDGYVMVVDNGELEAVVATIYASGDPELGWSEQTDPANSFALDMGNWYTDGTFANGSTSPSYDERLATYINEQVEGLSDSDATLRAREIIEELLNSSQV